MCSVHARFTCMCVCVWTDFQLHASPMEKFRLSFTTFPIYKNSVQYCCNWMGFHSIIGNHELNFIRFCSPHDVRWIWLKLVFHFRSAESTGKKEILWERITSSQHSQTCTYYTHFTPTLDKSNESCMLQTKWRKENMFWFQFYSIKQFEIQDVNAGLSAGCFFLHTMHFYTF